MSDAMDEHKDKPIQVQKWIRFAKQVTGHITDYVLPQYGDEGEEPAAEYTISDCVKQAQRYLARHGRSSREGETKRDMLKAAHWIQKAWDRMERDDDGSHQA